MKKLLSIILAIATIFSIASVSAFAFEDSLELQSMVVSHEKMIFDEDNDIVYITEPGWKLVDLAVHLDMADNYYYKVALNDPSIAGFIGTGAKIEFVRLSDGFPRGIYTVVVKGDIDGDSWCTMDDTAPVKDYLNGENVDFSEAQLKAIDIICDGKITAKDSAQMVNAANQVEEFDTENPSGDDYQSYLNFLDLDDVEPKPNAENKPSLWERFMEAIRKLLAFFGIKI